MEDRLKTTSGQIILTKGRIAGRIFHGGQRNMTPTSLEHCSRLQQSLSPLDPI